MPPADWPSRVLLNGRAVGTACDPQVSSTHARELEPHDRMIPISPHSPGIGQTLHEVDAPAHLAGLRKSGGRNKDRGTVSHRGPNAVFVAFDSQTDPIASRVAISSWIGKSAKRFGDQLADDKPQVLKSGLIQKLAHRLQRFASRTGAFGLGRQVQGDRIHHCLLPAGTAATQLSASRTRSDLSPRQIKAEARSDPARPWVG